MPLRRPALRFLPLWLLGLSGVALSLGWSFWPTITAAVWPAAPRSELPATLPFEIELPNDVAGVREPPARPAAEAGLADGEPVVGVTEGGRSRAYRLQALSREPASHVVNDVLGGVPVSVTHCGLYHCTRAFTGGTPGEPLDLAFGGVTRDGLILRSGGHSYRQDSGAPLDATGAPLPYRAEDEELTTWGQWRHEHPDTDVYVDPPPTEQSPPPYEVVARPLPFDLRAALASVVYVAAAPVLILGATALAHVLLAFVLGPRQSAGGSNPEAARAA